MEVPSAALEPPAIPLDAVLAPLGAAPLGAAPLEGMPPLEAALPPLEDVPLDAGPGAAAELPAAGPADDVLGELPVELPLLHALSSSAEARATTPTTRRAVLLESFSIVSTNLPAFVSIGTDRNGPCG
ncbi:MAG: hypothetical protein M3Y35_13780 [Actinomycetota bacterium]|nr:hypothetical protein [Actinomycetota bacterium]